MWWQLYISFLFHDFTSLSALSFLRCIEFVWRFEHDWRLCFFIINLFCCFIIFPIFQYYSFPFCFNHIILMTMKDNISFWVTRTFSFYLYSCALTSKEWINIILFFSTKESNGSNYAWNGIEFKEQCRFKRIMENGLLDKIPTNQQCEDGFFHLHWTNRCFLE